MTNLHESEMRSRYRCKLAVFTIALAVSMIRPASATASCSNKTRIAQYDSQYYYYTYTTVVYNFTCDEYCCGSSLSYGYCCSDCSLNVYSDLCPWQIGLIVFGGLVFLFLFVGLPIISCYCCNSNRVAIVAQQSYSTYPVYATGVATVAYPTAVAYPSAVAYPTAVAYPATAYPTNAGYPTNAPVAGTAVPQPPPAYSAYPTSASASASAPAAQQPAPTNR